MKHRDNYISYIGLRPGVDKIDDSQRHMPATAKQKQLISQILRDFPSSRDLFEYKDYLVKPTVENASEFIVQALDQNFDRVAKRENYVDYIAKRPRAERLGDHGLFTNDGTPVILSQVAREIADHKGNIWLPIISLRREDAERLGYDSGQPWRDLLRSQAVNIAAALKIKQENFRWFASFHNESHHPHVHMVCYSTNPREGYLTVKGIESMKSKLAGQIFRQDLLDIYAEQTSQRDGLGKRSEALMRELCCQIEAGNCALGQVQQLLPVLSERLQNTNGKKVYGYLPPDTRRLVDQIVDELAKDEYIAEMYNLWYEKRFDILRTYTDKMPDKIPLSQQKEFKPIRNMVIREALQIGTGQFADAVSAPLPDDRDAPPEEEFLPEMEWEIQIPDNSDPPPLPEEPPLEIDWELPPENAEPLSEPKQLASSPDKNDISTKRSWKKVYAPGEPHIDWTDNYKSARDALYGTDQSAPDFNLAFTLFLSEAREGNALAMHDLGRMFADGLGREIDAEQAQEWYRKALNTFLIVESTDEKHQTYAQYRIGKMYSSGLGTKQDYGEAASWFKQAVENGHKYAQYSLGGLYLRGQGVEQDYRKAFFLFTQSANHGNAYASYEVAKMLRDGVGIEKNAAEAERRF